MTTKLTISDLNISLELLIDLFCSHGQGMDKVLLGKACEPESSVIAGSCALLLAKMLEDRGEAFHHFDPHVDEKGLEYWTFVQPKAFMVATKHAIFKNYCFAPGSMVLDPFRYLPPQEGVRFVPIGVGE